MSCVLFGRELEIRVIFIWEGRIRLDKLHVYYFLIEGVNIFYSFCLFFNLQIKITNTFSKLVTKNYRGN